MFAQLFFWCLAVVVVAYLAATVGLVGKLEREQPEYWEKIGAPSLGNPGGQVAIFWKVLCGTELPESISSVYRMQLSAVRMLLAASVALTIVVTAIALLEPRV